MSEIMVKQKNVWSSRKGGGKWTGTKGPQQETSGKERETQEALDYKGLLQMETNVHLEKTEVLRRGKGSRPSPGRNSRSRGKELKKNPPKKKLESSKKKM